VALRERGCQDRGNGWKERVGGERGSERWSGRESGRGGRQEGGGEGAGEGWITPSYDPFDEQLLSFRHNLVTWEPSQPMTVIGDMLQQRVKSGAHGRHEDRMAFFRGPALVAPPVPSVKYVCERVFAIARELALGAHVDLQTSVKIYFQRYHVDPHEFWMILENEFALEILDDDADRVQTFSGAVRMVHVRVSRAAGEISRIRDDKPSDLWLDME